MGQEELAEATAMEKMALKQPLSPAEKKRVEKLELQVNERIAQSTKAIEEKVLTQKKKALELLEILEKQSTKSLTEVEKKQNREQIEKNALEYGKQLHEELAEEKAMSKKSFGHALNGVEQKQVEKYMATVQQQIDLNGLMSAF